MEKSKILVVDDSGTMRNLIRRELEIGNYEIIEAENGIMALTKAVKFLPDLITLDLDMPKLNGFETYKKINDQHYATHFTHKSENRIPIIFITANDTVRERQKGFELGAADFIKKPFAQGELLNIVNMILHPKKKLQGLKALVVDDSSVARGIVSDVLEREGIETLRCIDGLEAYTVLKKDIASFDLIVTDFEMPEMNGKTLCKKIRTELKHLDIPIIFLTGISEQGALIELFNVGATDYIVKPFVKEELVARIRVHIERSQLTKELKDHIIALKQANEEIRLLSITDPLTRCYNRGYFNEELPKEIQRARRYQRSLSVILCDIDHFKRINDTYGHLAGDLVLREFSDWLRSTVRDKIDWVIRYGGEEFLIVLPETDLEGASVLAERIRHTISDKELAYMNHTIKITSSFGVTGFDKTTDDEKLTVEYLVNRADELLYTSKLDGRNRSTVGEL
ncbi:MAG: diguanylate cyclase [Desulfobacterales bacterium]|nr:diguanylate cyclase [Desulfobacterales bacterium]